MESHKRAFLPYESGLKNWKHERKLAVFIFRDTILCVSCVLYMTDKSQQVSI
jgi:hypothetical protein